MTRTLALLVTITCAACSGTDPQPQPAQDGGTNQLVATGPRDDAGPPPATPYVSITEPLSDGTTRTLAVYGDDCTVIANGVTLENKATSDRCADLWTLARDATFVPSGCTPPSDKVLIVFVDDDGARHERSDVTYCTPGLPGYLAHKGAYAAFYSAGGRF